MSSIIIIHTVNKKAVKIIERYTHNYLVQFIKSGKFASVSKQFVKSFKKEYKSKALTQLKLKL